MTEHEAGPLDDKPEALHAANTLLRKRREMRRMYAAPPIRSGLCSHCGAFGSLWHQTDSCESCFREFEAPQPVTFVYPVAPIIKATPERARPTFANAAWMVTIWLLAMTGLGFIGWHGMRAVGWLCFKLGELL